ncbi:NRR repressor homolog 1-like [Panicum virgatum]|uniref:NRR repressor homolog 1-like n=1 Tax=Panicum virgatum TaxID=38727 RepID=UPI0019D5A1E3|nr:NRR repressor homolog 1-like [Panicum virgatum]
MRGAYGAGDGDGDGGSTGADGVVTGGGGGGARKRLRAAEPPWRPAFRLEDFEEPSPTSSKRASRQEDDGERPAAPSAPPRRAGGRLDGGRKSGARADVSTAAERASDDSHYIFGVITETIRRNCESSQA